MQKKRIFISSVQSEFSQELQLLCDYLFSDALLGRFFDPFIFENVPALNAHPSEVFLGEVKSCDIFLCLLGINYGLEDNEAISPTEREFDCATENDKIRLAYVKNTIEERHPKEILPIKKAENSIVRRGFETPDNLKAAVYASLVSYLIENELIRTSPFDATLHPEAIISDLDELKIKKFVAAAHKKRNFPFDEDANAEDILTHLNLVKSGRVTHAALLLFADNPQRFFITSELKWAHFHGVAVSKPIPSYQVYKGDVFEMVAQAVDFVLSKINLYVGSRTKSETVDVEYEIPVEAVTEAIVNAVAHRDYTSHASVQVMLFADRLEISNPGKLPFGLTVEKLFVSHNSIPANPLQAEPMYLNGTIERMGTGTQEIVGKCKQKGLVEPSFVQDSEFKVILFRPHFSSTHQETHQEMSAKVHKLLQVMEDGDYAANELMEKIGLTDKTNFRAGYLKPAIESGMADFRYKDNPTHRNQRYFLTEKGSKKRKQ